MRDELNDRGLVQGVREQVEGWVETKMLSENLSLSELMMDDGPAASGERMVISST